MLKNKFAIVLLVVVMLCCVVFISGCGGKNLMEDGEYNAVRIMHRPLLLSWSFNVEELKIEIKNNKLFIDDTEMGKLSSGKISQNKWMWPDLLGYDVEEGVNSDILDTLMNIENCFVSNSKTSIYGVDYFYLISSENSYYLLCASKPLKKISSVYLLDEIGGGNEA